MPQLDTFTYLSQLFWVFVLFSGFYVLVLSDILPSFSQILKTRKKKLDQNGDNIENLFKEESEAYSQYEDNVVLSLEESREM
jgi:F0F1-type ATP synthase membrane subunit b/b'